MVKTFKNLLLRNQKAYDLETWYVAWVLEYHQNQKCLLVIRQNDSHSPGTVCSNDDPVLTLTFFTARSNLVPYVFVWEKGKTMDISETIAVCDVKVGRCS